MGDPRMIGRMIVMTSVLVLSVAGCAGNVAESPVSGQVAPNQPAGSAPSAAAQPPEAQPQTSDNTISAQIIGGKVTGVPGEVEVNRGSGVRIEVTSDRSDELHVHGYDKTVALVPGKPGTVQFVADVPGVFEVETHEGGLLLFELVVRG